MSYIIKNISKETLLKCFSVHEDNKIIFYLKANKSNQSFYFYVPLHLDDNAFNLIKSKNNAALSVIDAMLYSKEIHTYLYDVISNVDNNTLYPADQKEYQFQADIRVKLSTKQFTTGEKIGRYLDKPIYSYIEVNGYLFHYKGIVLPQDISCTEYTIDKEFSIVYNNITYQYVKGV